MSLEVHIPRVNANDDQVIVIALYVAVGDRVNEGDLLADIETTKATTEVLSPGSGTVASIAFKQGEPANVGEVFCVLSSSGDLAATTDAGNVQASRERTVTAKARRRAKALGVDIDTVPTPADGRITVEAVDLHADTRTQSIASRQEALQHMKAIIVGGSGHAAAICDALAGQGMSIVGCVDDDPSLKDRQVVSGIQVLGTREILPKLFDDGVRCAYIGVGGIEPGAPDAPNIRSKIFDELVELGFTLPPVVSRGAQIGLDCTLGPGSVVMPGAVVGARCRIGVDVIVNQGCQVCHDTVVADHAHIAPGALIGGSCSIGRSSVIGMGSAIFTEAHIGAYCLVHNNASVFSNVADNTEVYADGRRFPRE